MIIYEFSVYNVIRSFITTLITSIRRSMHVECLLVLEKLLTVLMFLFAIT